MKQLSAIRQSTFFLIILLASILITGCADSKGKSGSSDPATDYIPEKKSFTIGGTVEGSTGAIELQMNLKDSKDSILTVIEGNGSFKFSYQLSEDDEYSVLLKNYPTDIHCAISNNSGKIISDVTDIKIACSKDSYSIGGTVTGLSGTVSLKNNSETVNVTEDGTFQFLSKLPHGLSYNVTIQKQPDSQTCTVNKNSGTSITEDVKDITVTCSDNAYSIGGTITGSSGAIIIQNNGADDLIVYDSSEFTFDTKVVQGAQYNVTIKAQSTTETCEITNGSGTVTGDITSIQITCSLKK